MVPKSIRKGLWGAAFGVMGVCVLFGVWYVRGRNKTAEIEQVSMDTPKWVSSVVPSSPVSRSTSATADVTTRSSGQEVSWDTGLDIEPSKKSKVLELAVSLKEERERRQEFFLSNDKGMLSWPTLSSMENSLRSQVQARFEPADPGQIAAIVEEARAKMQEFWKAGGLSNDKGYLSIYESQLLGELAIERAPQREEVYFLVEDILMTTALTFSPFMEPQRRNEAGKLMAVIGEANQSLFLVSVAHYYRIVRKKSPQEVTLRDLATMNRIIHYMGKGSILGLSRGVQEIKELLKFDVSRETMTRMGQKGFLEQAEKENTRLLSEMKNEIADRCLQAVRQNGWRKYEEDFVLARQCLLAGNMPPPFTIFTNAVLMHRRGDWEGFYTLDRRNDGYSYDYMGQPAYVPWVEVPSGGLNPSQKREIDQLYEEAGSLLK